MFIFSPKSDGFYIFYISQGSVTTQLRFGGVFIVTTLLQIFYRMRQLKNFENRSIFDKDMDRSLWLIWGTLYTSLINLAHVAQPETKTKPVPL